MTLHSEFGRKELRKKAGKIVAGIRDLKNGIPAKTRKRGGETDLQKQENLRQNERVRVKNGARKIWKRSRWIERPNKRRTRKIGNSGREMDVQKKKF
jgi:hypothetical protein